MDVSTETKSRKKSSDRKLEILRTLVRMMTESENKHITTKSLAAAIGISEAALYRHFPSKAKMYEEIIGFAENYVMTAVNNISSSEYSGLEQAKKLFLALVDIKAKEPGLVFLFCGDSLTSEDPRLQGELNRFYGQLQAVFKQSLRLAVAQEEVPEGIRRADARQYARCPYPCHWLRFAKRDASGGAVDPEKQVYLVLGK